MMAESGAKSQVPMKQGAEARLYETSYFGKPAIIKERFSKKYRHPTLDKTLTLQRTKSEVRSMIRCRINGIYTPAIYHVDLVGSKIYMEHVKESVTVKDYIASMQSDGANSDSNSKLTPLAVVIGSTLANMHSKNIIHGDLTTSNMLLRTPVQEEPQLVMIDFGLGSIGHVAEDKGVDLYVLERAFLSTHPNTESVFEVILNSYKEQYGKGSAEILKKFEEVRLRGRKRTMIG